MTNLDQDAVLAAADLVNRSGARSFQIGYLNDDPADPAWYAHAQYKGVRIAAEHHPGPVEAAEALARRLLDGAKCRCGKLVALSDDGAMVYRDTKLLDGTTWTPTQAARAGQCRWTRQGKRWEPGCNAPPIRMKGHR